MFENDKTLFQGLMIEIEIWNKLQCYCMLCTDTIQQQWKALWCVAKIILSEQHEETASGWKIGDNFCVNTYFSSWFIFV